MKKEEKSETPKDNHSLRVKTSCHEGNLLQCIVFFLLKTKSFPLSPKNGKEKYKELGYDYNEYSLDLQK